MCFAIRQIDLASDCKKGVIMQEKQKRRPAVQAPLINVSMSGIVQSRLDLQQRNWWVNSYCETNVKTGFPPEPRAWRFPAWEDGEKSHGMRAKPSAGEMSGRFEEICGRWISGPLSSERLWDWKTDWRRSRARVNRAGLMEDNGSIECEQRVFHTPWMFALSWDEIIN